MRELYLGWDPRKLWVSLGEPDFYRIFGLRWIPTVRFSSLLCRSEPKAV